MSDRSGVRNLVAALGVRRRAAWGFGAGALLALALYVFFVVLPASPHPARYALLAFVVAVSTGMLFTGLLVAAAAYRLAGEVSA